jgi:hypothetical protein
MRKRTLSFQPCYNEEEEDVQMEDYDDDADVSAVDALVEKPRQCNNKRRSICGRYEKRIPEDLIEDNLEVVRDSSVEDPLEDFLAGCRDGDGGDAEATETILPDLLGPGLDDGAEEGDGLCCKQEEETEDRGQQERQVQMVWVAAEGEEEEEEEYQRAYSSDVLTRQPEITFTGKY